VSQAALVAAVIIVLIVSGATVAIVVIQSSSASSASSSSYASSASSAPNGGNQISVSSSLLPLLGVQVAVTSQNLVAADFLSTDAATPLTCDVSGAASDLTLTNTGTYAASVSGVTITWAGALNYFSVPGTCIVEPKGGTGAANDGNPMSILFSSINHIGTNAVAGQKYTGTVELGNGAELDFSGTFK
jgi:hypothetical protein